MDIEQIGQMIQQLGESFGPKIQKFMDTSSMNAKVSDAKKELDKSYCELGKGTYEKFSDAPIEGLEEQFEAVKTSLAGVNELNAQLQQIKGVKSCPGCGKESPMDAVYCAACGAKLPAADTPEPTADVKACDSEPLVVSTTYGKVQGITENGYVAFKGIPFAKPPVGELRWREPQDPEPFNLDELAVDAVTALGRELFIAAVMISVYIQQGSPAHGDKKAQVLGLQVSGRQDQIDPVQPAGAIKIPEIWALLIGDQQQLHRSLSSSVFFRVDRQDPCSLDRFRP